MFSVVFCNIVFSYFYAQKQNMPWRSTIESGGGIWEEFLPPIWTATNCAAAGFDIRNLMWAFALFKLALIQLAYQLNQYNSNGFGKGRVREGKILSLQGFPSRIELLHNRSFNQASTIFS